MEILKNSNNLNIVVNSEQSFRTDLGWQDNLAQFEDEILKDIINPSKNYETVRYIHKPYDKTISGITMSQTDIWFQFYFATSDGTPNYVLDYNPVGISTQENELMMRQATESFFRLEFYKTSGSVTNYVLTCEAPTRQNRRLINSKNLSLPLGEKYFHTGDNYGYYIHVPIFTGSNYRNKENMYLFWFDDESVLTDTNLSGTTTLDKYSFTATTVQTILFMNENNIITQVNIPTGTTSLIGWTGQTFNYPNLTYEVLGNLNDKPGQKTPFYHGMNTFFMTAKFFNADRGEILDFINSGQTTSYNITEEKDMYYQIDFDHFERTYQIYRYTGTTKLGRIGTGYTTTDSITFYEKGGGVLLPVSTPTPTPIGGVTATPRPTSTPFPTSTPTPVATVIPTITPTPTESPCVTSVSFEVDFGGTVRYFNCEGSEVTETFGIGPQVINDCIQNNSLSGVIASISSVFYGETSCLPSTATPLPPTPTPTSTPVPNVCNQYTIDNQTESSISISYYNCSGTYISDNLGSGNQITFCANQSYGLIDYSSGTLTDLGLCSTPTPTATLDPSVATPTPTGLPPTPTPTGLPPTPTPTGLPPTATPTPSYQFYTADRYDCSGENNTCESIETGIQIANPTVLIPGKFYYDSTNDYIFNIVGDPGAAPYLITNMSGLGTNNCNSLCNV